MPESKEIPFVSCPIRSEDFELFKSIINQGIDSRLEAFTKSHFEVSHHTSGRFDFFFHDTEIPLLLRKLSEMDTEIADQWESDILETEYGIDCFDGY